MAFPQGVALGYHISRRWRWEAGFSPSLYMKVVTDLIPAALSLTPNRKRDNNSHAQPLDSER